MTAGFLEALIFFVGVVAGWILTSRKQIRPTAPKREHNRLVKAENKRLKAKVALIAKRHNDQIIKLEKKQNIIDSLTDKELASKLETLYGDEK